jgi:hypothetical protein
MLQSIVIMVVSIAVAAGIGRVMAGLLTAWREDQRERQRIATLRREGWIS